MFTMQISRAECLIIRHCRLIIRQDKKSVLAHHMAHTTKQRTLQTTSINDYYLFLFPVFPLRGKRKEKYLKYIFKFSEGPSGGYYLYIIYTIMQIAWQIAWCFF